MTSCLLPKWGLHVKESIFPLGEQILSFKSWLILKREQKAKLSVLFPLKVYLVTLQHLQTAKTRTRLYIHTVYQQLSFSVKYVDFSASIQCVCQQKRLHKIFLTVYIGFYVYGYTTLTYCHFGVGRPLFVTFCLLPWTMKGFQNGAFS